MPMAKITPAGESGLYHVHFLDGRTDPGFGTGGLPHPDQGLPGRPPHVGGGPIYHPGHPDHGLPSGGHIDNSLPGGPNHPDNRPPSGPPPQVGPGEVLVLVRDQAGVWHYASLPAGSPPPKPVPVPPPLHPGNRPPGSGAPPVAGQPLPPTAAPKA